MSGIRTAAVAVLAVFLLAGCFSGEPEVSMNEQVPADQRAAEGEGETEGEGEAPAEAEAVAEFVAVDIDFAEAPEELPAGPVEFRLVNDGAADHNVTVEALGETVVEAPGGETASGTVELQPGDYEYYCSIPGHEDLMQGTFAVTS